MCCCKVGPVFFCNREIPRRADPEAPNPARRLESRTWKASYLRKVLSMILFRRAQLLPGGRLRYLYEGMIKDPRSGYASISLPQFASYHAISLTDHVTFPGTRQV